MIDDRCVAGTPAPSTPLLDSSQTVIKELFAPFPANIFPLHPERAKLVQLFETPFSITVPVSQQAYVLLDKACPNLFRVDTISAAPTLEWRLATALEADFRSDNQTELSLTSFWDMVGFGLPDWAAKKLFLNISTGRYGQLVPATFIGWLTWGASTSPPGFGRQPCY